MKLLLDAGANVCETDDRGGTVLMYAASCSTPKILKLLLDKGINNINAQDENGMTALMLAAHSNSAEVITMLLDGGADVSLEDKNGKRAVDYIQMRSQRDELNNPEILKRLQV